MRCTLSCVYGVDGCTHTHIYIGSLRATHAAPRDRENVILVPPHIERLSRESLAETGGRARAVIERTSYSPDHTITNTQITQK